MWWNKRKGNNQKNREKKKEAVIFVEVEKLPIICEKGKPTFCFHDSYGGILKIFPRRGTRKDLLNNFDRLEEGCFGVIIDECKIVIRYGSKIYLVPYEERRK